MPGTEVRDTGTAKGRGVFALRMFKKDEVVEEAQVIVTKLGGSAGDFRNYSFNWSHLIGQGSTRLYQAGLALGNGSLYNSANPANMRYVANDASNVLVFIAARDISAGEELTINYSADGGGIASADDRWFTKRGISPLA
jgi:hypothetical protein